MNQGQGESRISPCQSCGACCAHFRVAFYWVEANNPESHNVPPGLCEPLDQFKNCMKGTNAKHRPRCTALVGRIGERVGCTIYPNRPSPCRDFEASYANGSEKKNKRCDEARLAHGLKPLQKPSPAVVHSEP